MRYRCLVKKVRCAAHISSKETLNGVKLWQRFGRDTEVRERTEPVSFSECGSVFRRGMGGFCCWTPRGWCGCCSPVIPTVTYTRESASTPTTGKGTERRHSWLISWTSTPSLREGSWHSRLGSAARRPSYTCMVLRRTLVGRSEAVR